MLILLILSTDMLSAKNKTMNSINEDIKETIKIKNIRNGKVYTEKIYVLKDSNKTEEGMGVQSTTENITQYAFSNGNKFNSKSKIMIKFKSKDIKIEKIEKKYHLKLKRKMNSGDYLFENKNGNTLNIINLLLKDEASNIERVSPDMILNMKAM